MLGLGAWAANGQRVSLHLALNLRCMRPVHIPGVSLDPLLLDSALMCQSLQASSATAEGVEEQLRLMPAGHQPLPVALRFAVGHSASVRGWTLFTGGPEWPALGCLGLPHPLSRAA